MTPQEEYEEGQKDGSQSDAFGRWCHDFWPGSEAYEKGYENGCDNRPSSNDDDDD